MISKFSLFLILLGVAFRFIEGMEQKHKQHQSRPLHSFYRDTTSSRRHRQQQHRQRVLLISLDGFRHDFIEAYELKNLRRLAKESASSLYLNPEFCTESVPNHWSMVTGSHVEEHGLVGDKFYDPKLREHFTADKVELKWWNASEPIWSTAANQGIKTGVFDWPGSRVEFETHPQTGNATNTYHLNLAYQTNNRFRAKLNQALKLFLRHNYQFISIQHDQPDQIAHKYGLNSPEFNVTLEQLDHDMGYLLDRLAENRLYSAPNFNLMLASGHGVANIKKIVFINEYILESDAKIWSFSQTLIHLKPLIDLNTLLMKLSRIPGVSVTLRENLPQRLNYRENDRIADIIISAVEGVGFMYMNNKPFQISNNGQISYFRLTYTQKKQLMMASADRATHGYDNLYPSMRGIFIAHGAIFKSDFIANKHLEMVDVYPLLCHTLGIECPQRNGSLHRSRALFKNEHALRVASARSYDKHMTASEANSHHSKLNCESHRLGLVLLMSLHILSSRVAIG